MTLPVASERDPDATGGLDEAVVHRENHREVVDVERESSQGSGAEQLEALLVGELFQARFVVSHGDRTLRRSAVSNVGRRDAEHGLSWPPRQSQVSRDSGPWPHRLPEVARVGGSYTRRRERTRSGSSSLMTTRSCAEVSVSSSSPAARSRYAVRRGPQRRRWRAFPRRPRRRAARRSLARR